MPLDPADLLFSFPRYGTGAGLHRTAWLLDASGCSEWVTTADVIGVTGSAGKGSVTLYTAAILSALGVRTGAFVSPHLFRPNERVRVDGELIGDVVLSELLGEVALLTDAYARERPGDRFSRFEVLTALAVRHFAREAARTAVVESGIGGRLDPTRGLRPRLAALTSVEREHAEFLGDSPELIAYDKADLCREGGTLVVGDIDPEVRHRLTAYCRVRGVRMLRMGEAFVVDRVEVLPEATVFGVRTPWGDLAGLRVPGPAAFQAGNAALAVALAGEWVSANHPEVGWERFAFAVRRGLEGAQVTGRFERVREYPPVYVDVGHTPQSALALARAVRAALPARRILLVTGVSTDKDAAGIITALAPLADRVICTRAYHNGRPAAEVAELVQGAAPDLRPVVVDRIEDAMARAVESAAVEGLCVVVAGGLFLAVEAAASLRGDDPASLRFV